MEEQSRRIVRLIRFAAVALLASIGAFLATAAVLGRVPVNAGWTEPVRGITIFIQTNGVHTGIVLPDGPHRWRAFGWGDRAFYLNTPTWADMRPGTVSVMPSGLADQLSKQEVADLLAFLKATRW